MPNTLIITKDHLDADNRYTGDVTCVGNIEISENLGIVIFDGSLIATGCILAKAGSGIEAGWGI